MRSFSEGVNYSEDSRGNQCYADYGIGQWRRRNGHKHTSKDPRIGVKENKGKENFHGFIFLSQIYDIIVTGYVLLLCLLLYFLPRQFFKFGFGNINFSDILTARRAIINLV